MKWILPKFAVVSVGAALALGACASIPTGPSVLVLPGNGKSFEQTLIIGESAFIEAQLRAPVIVIAGHVVGNVAATERVEFRRSAHVVGDLEAPVFVIEAGAVFEGRTTRPTPEGPESGRL
ncbi:MAG: hypothetical protein DME08_21480 [Candidatus Rokuibacteriota bacterium]|nr:MAG: hypothetical protein DME08_21480 [Candidatus Rokubacteria bacterium]